MREQEEEGLPVANKDRITRKVSMSISTPTPVGSYFVDAYFVDANLVKHYILEDQIPTGLPAELVVGENFDIHAKCVAANPDGGGTKAWETMITAMATDLTMACYGSADAWGELDPGPDINVSSEVPAGYALPLVMPDRDLIFVVKLWGNETRGEPPPPLEQWL